MKKYKTQDRNLKVSARRFLNILLSAITFAFLLEEGGFAQWKGNFAPPYLADEIFRLSRDCYYFKEFLLIKQNNKQYVLACFLNREAMSEQTQPELGKPSSTCAPRMQQIRLYRLVNDKKVVFRDSVMMDKFAISLGNASDFDNSGLTKIIVNHRCAPPQGALSPLLCYAFSIYGITRQEKLRSALMIANLPERYIDGRPQGYALEPVVTDNFDKSRFPECLAIDDFWEGDFAFRSDDFPKVTLVYVWDSKLQTYGDGSGDFVPRFTLPASVDEIPADIPLRDFIQNAMSLAAVGKHEAASKYIDLGLTPRHVESWKAKDEQRAKHIEYERLKTKLLACIARYKSNR